jgi:hypothetical protein
MIVPNKPLDISGDLPPITSEEQIWGLQQDDLPNLDILSILITKEELKKNILNSKELRQVLVFLNSELKRVSLSKFTYDLNLKGVSEEVIKNLQKILLNAGYTNKRSKVKYEDNLHISWED